MEIVRTTSDALGTSASRCHVEPEADRRLTGGTEHGRPLSRNVSLGAGCRSGALLYLLQFGDGLFGLGRHKEVELAVAVVPAVQTRRKFLLGPVYVWDVGRVELRPNISSA